MQWQTPPSFPPLPWWLVQSGLHWWCLFIVVANFWWEYSELSKKTPISWSGSENSDSDPDPQVDPLWNCFVKQNQGFKAHTLWDSFVRWTVVEADLGGVSGCCSDVLITFGSPWGWVRKNALGSSSEGMFPSFLSSAWMFEYWSRLSAWKDLKPEALQDICAQGGSNKVIWSQQR